MMERPPLIVDYLECCFYIGRHFLEIVSYTGNFPTSSVPVGIQQQNGTLGETIMTKRINAIKRQIKMDITDTQRIAANTQGMGINEFMRVLFEAVGELAHAYVQVNGPILEYPDHPVKFCIPVSGGWYVTNSGIVKEGSPDGH